MRLLKPLGLALGLFASVTLVQSCVADRATAPKLERLGTVAMASNATGIVISQVYGGGGNAGAVYKNDFVELFNPTTAPISVTGWSVQYTSAAGSTWNVATLAGTIAPGQYYLVQQAAGSNASATPLPTPDANGTATMGATAGKVFLLSTTTAATIACPTANVVDKVSYGSTASDCGYGRTAPNLDNNIAALRKNGGCEWTPALGADFQNTTPPTPRNSATPPAPCGVTQTLDHVVFQTPTPGSVTVGGSVTITAIAQDLSNNAVSATYSWSTDNPAVTLTNTNSAAVTVTGVTADQTANVKVTATRNGVTRFATQAVSVSQPVVASVTVSPASATILNGATGQFSAEAFDGAHVRIDGTAFTWSSSDDAGASVDGNGLVTARAAGDYVITAKTANNTSGTATLRVDPVVPPPTVRFSELHYDNTSTDQGEAIEIEGPAGTDLSGWKIVLYNGNPAPADQFNTAPLAAYDTRILSGIIELRTACNGRGVLTFTYPVNGIQNGSQNAGTPDGLALVDPSNQVVEFLSYEGTFTAVDGAAAGKTSRNMLVMEDLPVPAVGRSLQRSTDGTAWAAPALATFDRCNLEGPPPPQNGITFSGRLTTDPPIPVGFEDQIFGTLHDAVTNAVIPATFTWTALTPAIATIDAKGVIRGVSVGTASFKATANDAQSSSAIYSLAIADPQPTSGIWGGNTEFGTPIGVNDVLIQRDQFTASFSLSRNIPNWVSAKMEPSHIGSGVDRCDCFTYDPIVAAAAGSVPYTTGDYTGAGAAAKYGIDRGHLLRSSDVTASDGDNKMSYYFSNIVPQAAHVNQQGGPWFAEEVYLGDLVRTGGKDVWIIAGAYGSKGFVKSETTPGITIPTHLWKVAIIMPRGRHLSDVLSPGDIQVVARIYPNDPFTYTDGPANGRPVLPSGDWNYSGYHATVDQVEAVTGYNLLDLLPDQIEIAVESNTSAPVARTGGPYTGSEGSSVTMSAATSTDADDDALTYAWSFGDGATGTGVSPSHTYARYGDYTVTMTTTDTRGLFNTTTTTARVENVPPTLDAIAGATLLVGNTYTATGSFTDPGADPFSATVDYGDGSGPSPLPLSGNSFSLSHTYASHGTFTVSVALSDGQDTRTGTATVVVRAIPVANAGGPYAANEGAGITLSGAASSDVDGTIAAYAWDFGDGSTGSVASPTHTYANEGTYNVSLTVTDNDGLTSSAITTVVVSNVPPSIATLPGATILPGESFSTSGSFTDPGADSWSGTVNYGDGAGVQALSLMGMNFSLSHTYSSAGTFTVVVNVNDATATSTRTATVTVDSWSTGIDKLGLMVGGLGLSKGNANSLQVKLNAAQKQIERDRNTAPAHMLDPFVNELEAMVNSGRITSSAAAPLIAYAQRIAASIAN